jgi:DNA-binding response OmpR family regulator
VVLDVMMPGPDGLDICRELRRGSDVPSSSSARTGDVDRIAGLAVRRGRLRHQTVQPRRARRAGAERAAPRRTRRRGGAAARIQLADLTIDLNERSATIDGAPVQLSRRNSTCSRRWPAFRVCARSRSPAGPGLGSRYYGDQRTVDVHIAWLREADAEPAKIQTVWGVGYKLVESADEPARPPEADMSLRTTPRSRSSSGQLRVAPAGVAFVALKRGERSSKRWSTSPPSRRLCRWSRARPGAGATPEQTAELIRQAGRDREVRILLLDRFSDVVAEDSEGGLKGKPLAIPPPPSQVLISVPVARLCVSKLSLNS